MKIQCPACEAYSVNSGIEIETFEYGQGAAQVQLQAAVRVYSCSACGLRYTDSEAEIARHAAVCRHFGVSTPEELVANRLRLDLTQEEVAELTDIGIASISRWESGAKIQNRANDNLLFLIEFEENRERLRRRKLLRATPNSGVNPKVVPIKKERRFPTIKNIDVLVQRAEYFELRKA